IVPSSLSLKNNLSPTHLPLPNSAPHSVTAYQNISDSDNPFDDSKEVDPFADYYEADNESPPNKTSTSYPRPRRHSHNNATSKEIKNIRDNLIDTNSNLHHSSSRSVPLKPPRKPDNSISNSCDLENRPSLPPRPPNKLGRQTPPPPPL